MKIKIISCNDFKRWYRNRIGEVFKVISEEEDKYRVAFDSGNNLFEYFVGKSDCSIKTKEEGKMDSERKFIEKRLTEMIEYSIEQGEDLDASNWKYEEGVILSVNEAKIFLELLKKDNGTR